MVHWQMAGQDMLKGQASMQVDVTSCHQKALFYKAAGGSMTGKLCTCPLGAGATLQPEAEGLRACQGQLQQ